MITKFLQSIAGAVLVTALSTFPLTAEGFRVVDGDIHVDSGNIQVDEGLIAVEVGDIAIASGNIKLSEGDITAGGLIWSQFGGIKFPDGSVQLGAAVLLGECPTLDPDDEMIWVGGVCIDKYEASIWTAAVGGQQIIGTKPEDYCNPNGQDCTDIYARSVEGVEPAANITWFQAQQALANSGKRLPTNAEWQMAVRDTPDHPGPCNTGTGSVEPTGARLGCVSDWGVFDMVGNLWEWVADWVPASTSCPSWGSFSDDVMCLAGASTNTDAPGALARGGGFLVGNETLAGPFAILGNHRPPDGSATKGFRGAR